MKRKSAQITSHYWTCDFAFCAITQNLNEVINSLQGTNQIISAIFAKIKASESKLRMRELIL
jgi:hypothetical protein